MRWVPNGWREGLWVVLVVVFWSLLTGLYYLLDAVLWFVVAAMPPRMREISRSFGRTDDIVSENIRALFTAIFVAGTILFAVLHFWFIASIMFAIALLLTLWQRYETRRCIANDLDPSNRSA